MLPLPESTPPLDVGTLVASLQGLPEDMPVTAIYDCGTAGGNLVGVKTATDAESGREAVVLVVD